jgi:SUKH-4 immunity protein
VITPKQFRERWEGGAEGDRLNSFPEASLADVRLSADVRGFMFEAGLPADAAPCLYFGPPKSGSLPRVSVIWNQRSDFDRYRIIGGNGSGDPVCLDEDADGQIVYLNHDNSFQRVLMASSVFTMAECLVELRDVIDEGGDTDLVAPERYERLLERFRIIDPATCEEGGFWPVEIELLKPKEPAKWWQPWKRKT